MRIAAVNNPLFLLAHEFGHVKYQVPNLATYFIFYSRYYLENSYKGKSLGHKDHDLSGRQARVYGNRFRKEYISFQKSRSIRIDSDIAFFAGD